jgi:hypothetical protein
MSLVYRPPHVLAGLPLPAPRRPVGVQVPAQQSF